MPALTKAWLLPQKLFRVPGLLDNDIMYNKTPGITEAGTDDYYMTYATWQSARTILRNGLYLETRYF